mmetsp:Transcript_8417/g.22751  ORF Transcript_8417/g.22751 Transcript_8417/m.22751 type:complete len:202 (+) Transcript_8417:235-840(+)
MVHVLRRDHVDRASNAVLGTIVKHLLCLSNRSDHAPDESFPSVHNSERIDTHTIGRQTYETVGSRNFEQPKVRIDVIVCRNRADNQIKGGLLLLQLLSIRGHKKVCPKLLGRFLLRCAGRQHRHMATHLLRELHSHLPKATETLNANFHLRTLLPATKVRQRRIHGDASTQERRCNIKGQAVRNRENVVLVHCDALGVPSE